MKRCVLRKGWRFVALLLTCISVVGVLLAGGGSVANADSKLTDATVKKYEEQIADLQKQQKNINYSVYPFKLHNNLCFYTLIYLNDITQRHKLQHITTKSQSRHGQSVFQPYPNQPHKTNPLYILLSDCSA